MTEYIVYYYLDGVTVGGITFRDWEEASASMGAWVDKSDAHTVEWEAVG